jgi:drug/metabolite transporter (DMT)-like permease
MTNKTKGELYAVLISLFESWFPILSIFILTSMDPLFAYALSIGVTSIIFMVMIGFQKKWSEFLIKEAYADLLWLTFYITLLFILIMVGLQYTTAGNMSVIISLQLFFSYLYFNVFGDEKMSRVQSLGAFLMGIGAIIILFPENFSLNQGDALIFFAAMIAPITAKYQKKARVYVSAKTILAFRNIVALPFILTLAFYMEQVPTLENIMDVWGFIVLNGVLVFALSKMLFIEGLTLIPITNLMALLSLMPLFTLIFAYLVLDEMPSVMQFFGIAPVLFGSYLITKRV